jgi:hypothetical protein
MAPVDWEPLIGLAPDQAPEAVHTAAFAADQFNVEPAPFFTVLGSALNFTLGAKPVATVTVCDWVALPPMPAQVSE